MEKLFYSLAWFCKKTFNRGTTAYIANRYIYSVSWGSFTKNLLNVRLNEKSGFLIKLLLSNINYLISYLSSHTNYDIKDPDINHPPT